MSEPLVSGACFVCGRPTLGIPLLDARLDSFMLAADASGRELGDAGYFGDCHQPCLARDPLGRAWSGQLARHFCGTLRYRLLDERPGLAVYGHPRSGARLLLGADGTSYVLSAAELDAAPRTPGGILVTRALRLRAPFAAGEALNTWFFDAVRSAEGLAIADFHRRLHVAAVLDDLARGRRLHGELRLAAEDGCSFSVRDGFDGTLDLRYEYEIPY